MKALPTKPIPDKIMSEVRLHYNAMQDIEKEMHRLKRKKELAHSKMWSLIEDNIPEAVGESCRLQIEKGRIEIGARSMKAMIERAVLGDEDEDED